MSELDKIEKKWIQQGMELIVTESDRFKTVTVNKIVVPKSQRGKGLGTKMMNEVIAYATQKQYILLLTPSSDFGGSITRLKKFYKSLGFVENKGRKKDYRFRELMYRKPD